MVCRQDSACRITRLMDTTVRRIDGSLSRIQARNYYWNHREEILYKKREQYKNNPERFIEAIRKFKQRYPLRFKSIQRRYNQKRR